MNTSPASEPRPGELFSDPIPPEWVAWQRPTGGRWHKEAESDSEVDCWTALYEAMDAVKSGSWDSCVLPYGQRP